MQASPRASWAQLHATTGIDPTTLSSRWRKLEQAGLAWTTCYPHLGYWNASFAYIEVGCVPGTRDDIVAELEGDTETMSIECTTGGRDLFLSVTMASIREIDHYVTTRVNSVPGVQSTHTHHIRRHYLEGADWRVPVSGKLAPRSARDSLAIPTRSSAPRFTKLEESIVASLGRDARQSATSIAEELGVSVSAITRSTARVISSKRARLRCDIAHTYSDWNVIAVLWISAPQQRLVELAELMLRFPQVRQCTALASEANFMVQPWMRSLNELDQIEEELTKHIPTARILDRWVVPRIYKRLGHVLDDEGRRLDFVPVSVQPSGQDAE